MNDFNLPLVLAEYLGKSAIVVAFGFTILAVVRSVFPSAAKHSLWLRVFAASLAIPVLLVIFPRWEIFPDLFTQPEFESPAIEIGGHPKIYTGMSTPEGGYIIPAKEPDMVISWPWVLFAIWGGGVFFLVIRAVCAGAYLRKIERTSKLASGPIFQKFTELNTAPNRRVKLLISPLVKSSFTWGLTRTRIVLPESAESWTAADLDMILLHELEHVRRRDAISVFISRIFLALNWVNPLAWLANHNAIRFREEACDARVLAAGHTSESYAEMLFRQAKSTSNPFLQTCATAVAESGTIEQRIKMILNPKSKNQADSETAKPVFFNRFIPFLVTGCVFAIGLAGCEKPEEATAPDPGGTKAATPVDSSSIKLFVDGKPVTLAEVEAISTESGDLTVSVFAPEETEAGKMKMMVKKLGDLGVHDISFTSEEPGAASPQLKLMNEKLDSIIIPSVELTDTPLADAAEFLRQRSVELDVDESDPAKKGINLIVAAGDLGDARLTLKLKNVPLRQALIFCAQLAGGGIKVDEYAVTIGYEKTAVSDAGGGSAEELIAGNEAKLKSIIIPNVEFNNTPFTDALQFLQQRSVELDPEQDPNRKGINFVLNALGGSRGQSADPFADGMGFDESAQASSVPVTLKLSNIPLAEALRYTCELAGYQYKVEPHSILISRIIKDPFSAESGGAPASVAAKKMPIATNEEKLKRIILPKVEFQDTPLQNALMFIQQKSVELDSITADPDKKGINIIFNADGDASLASTPITLKLAKVPLGEALRYATALGQLEFKVEPNAIVISPMVRKNLELYTHAYTIPREIFAGMKSEKLSIQKMLEASGVGFSVKGASVTAQPNERRIVMRNTLQEFESLEGFLETVKSEDQWSSDRE